MDFDSLVDDNQNQQAAPEQAPSQPLMFDDLKPDQNSPQQFDDLQDDSEKTSSIGQQALTAVEGVGRGLSFGLSDALAKGMRSGASALGVPDQYLNYVAPAPEEIEARKEASPLEAGASELAGNVLGMSNLPQIGSKAIDGAIKMGLMAGGDELSKAMLGTGDPLPAVASHIAKMGATGLLLGGIFGKVESVANSGLRALEDSKLGTKLQSFVAGMGHSASFPVEAELPSADMALKQMANIPEDLHAPSFRAGQDFYNTVMGKASVKGIKYLGDLASLKGGGGLVDLMKAHAMGTMAEKILNKALPKASKSVFGPALIRAAGSGYMENLSQVLDHASSCAEGAQKMSRGIEALFGSGDNKALEFSSSERDREKLSDFIENGGVEKEITNEAQQMGAPQGYAEGGLIQGKVERPNAIAEVFPEQNTLLSQARGRVSGYLNSIRPLPNTSKLPFDKETKDPQKQHEYNKVLDLANQPLSILKDIKTGRLVPKQVKHFTQMFPELHQELCKKITERMMNGRVDDEKRPPYHIRQGLSLFIGTNLDSTLTQPSMAAAQAVFANQQAQKPMPSKMSPSKIAQSSQTLDQGREARANKS